MSHRSGLDCFAKLGDANDDGENRSGEAGIERNEALGRTPLRERAGGPPAFLVGLAAYSSGRITIRGDAGPEIERLQRGTGVGGPSGAHMVPYRNATTVVASGKKLFDKKTKMRHKA